jgi:hypothetical protein
VGEAFYHLYTLENACKVQVDVMASGVKPVVPADDVIRQLSEYGIPPRQGPASFVNMSWDAVVRLMDQKDPSYRS